MLQRAQRGRCRRRFSSQQLQPFSTWWGLFWALAASPAKRRNAQHDIFSCSSAPTRLFSIDFAECLGFFWANPFDDYQEKG